MRAYNLFRRRDLQHVLCAVPEDSAVPGFLAEKAWEFVRELTEPATAPIGFNPQAAIAGVRFNGFYLFQSFSGARRTQS